MTDKSLKQQPLPATARQIKAALSARPWTKPGYRTHHVRPRATELETVNRANYFAGATQVSVSEHPGVEMLFFSDDAVAQVFFYFGIDSFESTSVYLWAQLAKQSRGVLDIGSYTGLYSLLAARVAPRAKIVAFEAVAHIADRLGQNADLNALSQIEVRCEAVSDFNSTAELKIYGTDANSGDSSLQDKPKPAHEKIDVPVRSIDSLDQDGVLPTRIDLIKIDTEGDEYQALDGARIRIGKDRPIIFAEVLNDDAVAKIAAFAGSLSYSLYFVNEEARSLTELMPDGNLCLPDELTRSRGFGNVLLCPDAKSQKTVVDLAQRFAQKPRILRQAQSGKPHKQQRHD